MTTEMKYTDMTRLATFLKETPNRLLKAVDKSVKDMRNEAKKMTFKGNTGKLKWSWKVEKISKKEWGLFNNKEVKNINNKEVKKSTSEFSLIEHLNEGKRAKTSKGARWIGFFIDLKDKYDRILTKRLLELIRK